MTIRVGGDIPRDTLHSVPAPVGVASGAGAALDLLRRHAPGGIPTSFWKARLKAASES